MSIVPISQMEFGESRYVRGEKIWKASTLYDYAKAKNYPTQEMPLFAVNLTTFAFECHNLYQFIFQSKRWRDCDYEIPIILDNFGQIADGYHRICKAILDGKETIKCIRLEEMPSPDFIEKNESNN